MKIIEKSGYQALPWVRYITQSGGKVAGLSGTLWLRRWRAWELRTLMLFEAVLNFSMSSTKPVDTVLPWASAYTSFKWCGCPTPG